MTERITPTNMNEGTWPKKYDNDEHERLNVTESKKSKSYRTIPILQWKNYSASLKAPLQMYSVFYNRLSYKFKFGHLFSVILTSLELFNFRILERTLVTTELRAKIGCPFDAPKMDQMNLTSKISRVH